MTLPSCPRCQCEFTYKDGGLCICPECAHEWDPTAGSEAADEVKVWKDAFGNLLADGDSVLLVKDLKVKGANQTLPRGTVIKSIRLTGDAQEIDCRHDTIKGLVLRAEFVRKR